MRSSRRLFFVSSESTARARSFGCATTRATSPVAKRARASGGMREPDEVDRAQLAALLVGVAGLEIAHDHGRPSTVIVT